MLTFNKIDEISVDALKTSNSLTGKLLALHEEEILIPVKQKLVKGALEKYSKITACGSKCFQIYTINNFCFGLIMMNSQNS
jgi:hypothetical protein